MRLVTTLFRDREEAVFFYVYFYEENQLVKYGKRLGFLKPEELGKAGFYEGFV